MENELINLREMKIYKIQFMERIEFWITQIIFCMSEIQ